MADTHDLHSVYQEEQAKWDAQAIQELDSLGLVSDRDFEQYASHASTMRGLAEFLGDLRGRKVLEIGCGLGQIAVLLAKSGADVTAFDISSMSMVAARRRAKNNDVSDRLNLLVSAGEQLPFADESFDVVFGKGVLHHLEPSLGAPELYRVLRPGGKAAFTEPMGMNPLLKFARAYLPYPGKNPRGADIPLSYREIREWGRRFSQFRVEEFQLLSMIERGLGFNRPLPALRRQRAVEVSAVSAPLLPLCDAAHGEDVSARCAQKPRAETARRKPPREAIRRGEGVWQGPFWGGLPRSERGADVGDEFGGLRSR